MERADSTKDDDTDVVVREASGYGGSVLQLQKLKLVSEG